MDFVSTKSMGTKYNKHVALHMIKNKYKDFRKIFTDGSKSSDNTTGAGYYVEDINKREYWRLDPNTSIAGAELTA